MKTKPVDTARQFIYSGRVGTTFNFADCRLLVGAPGMTRSLALDALQYLTRRGELTREGSHGAWLWTITDTRLVRNQEPKPAQVEEQPKPAQVEEQPKPAQVEEQPKPTIENPTVIIDQLEQEIHRLRNGWTESANLRKHLATAIGQAVHILGAALKR